MNPGDTLLLCTPCYPAYLGVAALTQSDLVEVPLLEKNQFLPDLSALTLRQGGAELKLKRE